MLVGAWLPLKDWDSYLCKTSGPVRYYSDGIFGSGVDIGTWQISGDVLTEIVTASSPEQEDWSPEDIGRPFVSTLRWLDEDRFLKRYADGTEMAFRRCPDQK